MKIAIIGAGISGLSCAYLLSQKDYLIKIFAKEFSPNITSNRAAAFWFPYHIRNDKRGIDWCRKSFEFYKELSNDAATGVSMHQLIKAIEKNVKEEDKSWLEFMPGNSYRMMQQNELKKNYAKAYEAIVPLIETQIFLPYLQKYLEEKNVAFIEKEVNDLNDFHDYDVVINCTGLGARKLCNDKTLIPVKGQVGLLSPKNNFPIFLDNEKPLYIVPRKDAIIVGGTYEDEIFAEHTEPSTIEGLLKNAYEVFPELKQQKYIGCWAGLRPFRPTVRLEKEPSTNIIHNYGHGGSGFTLSFGCAEEVADLVNNL
ncbi:MAG: FAD-dependent oxidoreductase [Chitinophagaceae bacterium]